VPALRPLFGFALAVAGTAASHAEDIHLQYDLSVSGIGVAAMAVAARIDDGTYAMQAKGETFGPASMFDDLAIDARVTGRIAAGTVAPETFGTDNVLNGQVRHARVTWTPTGEGVVQALHPTLAEEERSAIPDDARAGSLDPISALFAFALGGPATGTCEGGAKVFDGRRSYTLTLSPDRDGASWVKLDIGDATVVTLKCTISSQRTGGASPSSWFSSSGETEAASIWFWRDPKGRAIPVRVEADAPVGYAVGELAALPD